MQAIREVGGIPQSHKQSVDVTLPVGIVDRLENPILRTPLLFFGFDICRHSSLRYGGRISRTWHGRRSSERAEDTQFSARLVAVQAFPLPAGIPHWRALGPVRLSSRLNERLWLPGRRK